MGEHANEEQLCRLIDECTVHAEELSRHQFGNFVIQSLLEHGASHRRDAIVRHLLLFLPQLTMHRTASHVVQRALKHCSSDCQCAITNALLCAQPPHSLVEVAASRYGSYLVEDLQNVFGMEGLGAEVRRVLAHAPVELSSSQSFARVANKFGLLEAC